MEEGAIMEDPVEEVEVMEAEVVVNMEVEVLADMVVPVEAEAEADMVVEV